MFREEGSEREHEEAFEEILKFLSTVGDPEKTRVLKEQVEQVFPRDRILLFAVAKEWQTQERENQFLEDITDSLIEKIAEWREQRISPWHMQAKAIRFLEGVLEANEESKEIDRFLNLMATIELGLDIRFGADGRALWAAMRHQITDLDVLEEMVEGLKRVDTIDELRSFYE